jgi:hypothetical protein
MVASGFFNEVPARDAVASLSHRRAANKCGAAILPFDSGTALGWKKTIVGSEAIARPAISRFCRAGLALQRQARRRCSEITTTRRARINDKTTPGTTAGPTSMASRRSAFCHLKRPAPLSHPTGPRRVSADNARAAREIPDPFATGGIRAPGRPAPAPAPSDRGTAWMPQAATPREDARTPRRDSQARSARQPGAVIMSQGRALRIAPASIPASPARPGRRPR